MGFEHGYDEKIDVIDLIINVLKEHEKKLDELVTRLEEAPLVHPTDATEAKPKRWDKEPPRALGPTLNVILKEWVD